MDPKWRPFCSERCQLLDLGHWASGTYRVAGDKPIDDEENEKKSDA